MKRIAILQAKLAKEQAVLEEVKTTLHPMIRFNRAAHVRDVELRISNLETAIKEAH